MGPLSWNFIREHYRSATLCLKRFLAGSSGAKSLCLLWSISNKSGQARFEARKGNAGQISRQQTPNLKKICESVKQRQKVSLEQYAKTGGRGMDISLLSLNKSQPRMLDTSLQLWKSYLGIRTGVNKITPYQQMKCFNKSATSWFFRKWRNCSHLFGLMIVFFLFFDWFLSMICISIFYFFFNV